MIDLRGSIDLLLASATYLHLQIDLTFLLICAYQGLLAHLFKRFYILSSPLLETCENAVVETCMEHQSNAHNRLQAGTMTHPSTKPSHLQAGPGG